MGQPYHHQRPQREIRSVASRAGSGSGTDCRRNRHALGPRPRLLAGMRLQPLLLRTREGQQTCKRRQQQQQQLRRLPVQGTAEHELTTWTASRTSGAELHLLRRRTTLLFCVEAAPATAVVVVVESSTGTRERKRARARCVRAVSVSPLPCRSPRAMWCRARDASCALSLSAKKSMCRKKTKLLIYITCARSGARTSGLTGLRGRPDNRVA